MRRAQELTGVPFQASITHTALTIPHPHGGQARPANFQRYHFNGYGEPIVEGTASKYEPVWGKLLVAEPWEGPGPAHQFPMPSYDLLEASNDFHAGVQRALVHLSDFGVAADVL